MSEPNNTHSKVHKDAEAAVTAAQHKAPADALEQALIFVAKTMGIYRRELRAQGFSADEVADMLSEFHQVILARLNL